MDEEIATALQGVLERSGFVFRLGTKVTGSRRKGKEVVLTVEPAHGGTVEEITADTVLVAIGRRPYADGLGLETVGVARDNKGRVLTDAQFRTNVPAIYAIRDVIAGPMLAHKASEEGVVLMEHLAGMGSHVNYDVIPNIIYTWPEVAAVGKTEEELKADG